MTSATGNDDDDNVVASKVDDVQRWTNQDVLRWLLRVDQKQFLAPFVTNNVTGAVLLDVLEASPTSSITLAQLAGDPPELQLAGLHSLVAQLQPSKTISDGRNGWSFKIEVSEWRFFSISNIYRVRCKRYLKRHKDCKERMAILTLLVTTVTTIVSVVGSSQLAGSADNDDGAILSYLTTGLSAIATLFAGFSRIFDFDGNVMAWQECTESFCDMYTGLQEQLYRQPHRRDEYSVWRSRKKKRFESEVHPPEIDPDNFAVTMHQIARKQPETWNAVFSPFYHISWPGSTKLSALDPGDEHMGEPSNVPRWAWWLCVVEFEPIWLYTARLNRSLNTLSGESLSAAWPEQYEASLHGP